MSTTDTRVDLLVVGGGVNGCGIARDAAGRGLNVVLCEQDDIASHTSSWSSKLIHGGLRYLENYEFKMVREALGEREVLMNIAPHLIWPMTFVLPHAKHLRPAWMIRIGMFLYDHLSKRNRLPASAKITLANHPAGAPLNGANKIAFTYADCATMDSRLTLANAQDAAARGAEILTRTKCVKAERDNDGWRVQLESADGTVRHLVARALVNATGPWVADFIGSVTRQESRYGVRLVQGSHIIVPKMFNHDNAYIFQNSDNRVVFAIPYEQDFTLIGTTDVDYKGDPAQVCATEDEISYLCNLANDYFAQQLTPNDVVSSFAGVRPLFDDNASNASKVTREYVLNVDAGESGKSAPVLNVFGGKLTAFRQLAEKSVNKLLPYLECDKQDWTEFEPLHGGDIPQGDFEQFLESLHTQYPWLDEQLLYRYARQFGSKVTDVLRDATKEEDLGEYLGAGLYAAEVRYMMENEWARIPEDVLWRRTRQGLHADEAVVSKLEAFMNR